MEKQKRFKQTEVGIIPNDWEVKKLSEISTFENGKAHEQFIDDKGEFIVINSKFISTEGQVQKSSNKYLSPLQKGNIAIVMSDIPNGKALAKCFLVDKDNLYTLNQRIGCIKANEEIDNEYLFYKLNRNQYFLAFDSGSGQTNLKKSEIQDCPVALPPAKTEQTAIATVLHDADALISSVEKLIAKKRSIKQGAMQELLKPKAGWEVKKLGEVAILKARIGWQGLTTAEYRKSGDYFLITGTEFKNGFIDWENCVYVDEERYKQDKNIQIREHDVLVTKDGTIGKVALIKSVPKPATLNSGVFVIRPINYSFYSDFFYYLLLSEVFLTFLSQLSAGSTINHLYQKDFVSFQFLTPKTIEEQQRIVQILSDMDAEIDALERKLEKYRLIKQGMMQNLLTGRIRLV
ncbi:MAG: restriction endonuclease subunit S [Deltaproteobacteria bacterium]|nr:restriction endonuclease subunit S [Deltaproteobacteria bacterium]